ncbi:MAG TPA: hypothetical protein PLN52_08950 [Opitutaceae bacterium]|nr:hypothetical protein [Opitutaceae bacterium]
MSTASTPHTLAPASETPGLGDIDTIRPKRAARPSALSRLPRTVGAITLAAVAVGIGLVVSLFGALTSLSIAIFRRSFGSSGASSLALRKSYRRRLRRARLKPAAPADATVQTEAASA